MSFPITAKRFGLALAAMVVVIAFGVLLTAFPRHWRVLNQDGLLLCTISKGWSPSDVAKACGTPSKVGDQPKVVQSWKEFCSAPCELRGRHLIPYDCEGKVARVEPATADWQGCVLH